MTYKTLENACKKSISKKITFSDLVSRRFYHEKKGHTKLAIKNIDFLAIIKAIGSKTLLISDLEYYIEHGKNYGILERLSFNGKRWSYTAGQEYTSEIKTIRKILKEG